MKFNQVVGERSRTYIFRDGDMTIVGVTALCVRGSGTHRLETAAGSKYIVPTGWVAIKIDAEDWSL